MTLVRFICLVGAALSLPTISSSSIEHSSTHNHGQYQRQHAPAPGVRYGVGQLDGVGCVGWFDLGFDSGNQRPPLLNNTASAGAGERRLSADIMAGNRAERNTEIEQ